MRLGSYVLRTKTKLLIEPIYDLDLRSGNIEFEFENIFTAQFTLYNQKNVILWTDIRSF